MYTQMPQMDSRTTCSLPGINELISGHPPAIDTRDFLSRSCVSGRTTPLTPSPSPVTQTAPLWSRMPFHPASVSSSRRECIVGIHSYPSTSSSTCSSNLGSIPPSPVMESLPSNSLLQSPKDQTDSTGRITKRRKRATSATSTIKPAQSNGRSTRGKAKDPKKAEIEQGRRKQQTDVIGYMADDLMKMGLHVPGQQLNENNKRESGLLHPKIPTLGTYTLAFRAMARRHDRMQKRHPDFQSRVLSMKSERAQLDAAIEEALRQTLPEQVRTTLLRQLKFNADSESLDTDFLDETAGIFCPPLSDEVRKEEVEALVRSPTDV
ncbi:hypothetical protein EJ08DRAFT_697207 [Tothia fuscella]|uniref:Uncharacterized protein n=1 Tax=Tothia fuscella TaxID=1048955 RepID=A0A9P4NRE9_9PEZI|nr:hypothetical protein EJ08DRAFT_697207 [Tothia fuscella]